MSNAENNEFRDSFGKINDINSYEVIIIGSGPTGYTAGIYTSREKLKTLRI